MQNQTLLFPGFHLSTLRRRPRSGAERLADEQLSLRQKSFDQLKACFGKYIPEDRLKASPSGSLSRHRLFSKANIFWAFLSQVLDADGGCREVLRKLQAFYAERSLPVPSHSSAAYCKARKKLETCDLEAIFKHMAAPTPAQSSIPSLHGRRVIVADGTGLSMPDTAVNQQVWPQQKSQKPGCGFPRATLCACFCLQSGLLLSYALGNKKNHELPLFRQQSSTFKRGDIFLGDKGFTSYYDLSCLKKRGVDSVIALSRKLPVKASEAIKPLGNDDLLIKWKRPKWTLHSSYPQDGWQAQPEEMVLRQIKVHVAEPGFRVRSFYLITTLLDPKAYPAHVLCDLYFQRWDVELFFRNIKTTMGLDILRCKTPQMIVKEILMHFIAYNGIRHLMLEAALSKNKAVSRISFKGGLQALRQWLPHLGNLQKKTQQSNKIVAALLHAIAQNVICKRPGRSEPRVVKRRPKPYRLMTAPRQQMSTIIQQEKQHKSPLS